MELKDFIKQSLTDICEGVIEAQEALQEKDVIISPSEVYVESGRSKQLVRNPGGAGSIREVHAIEFNVAVTITEKAGDKAGIGVFAGIASIGGLSTNEATNQQVSTIKFSVPISLPPTYYKCTEAGRFVKT